MKHIYSQFRLEGRVISCSPVSGGHINRTYLLVTARPHLYILQWLNGQVFKELEGLMRNVAAVTAHLRARTADPRRALTLVSTLDGAPCLMTEEGDCWRVYEYITDSICLEAAETPEDLRQSGVAFGMFQRELADFPAETLTETIPHFHDTPDRFRLFRAAIAEDRAGRLAGVQDEVSRFLAREGEAGALHALLRAGELPLRVTHNDTKLTNVMLDETTREPLCVIDLDTVMPGLAAHDYGDAIRFGASTAAEDETDLSKVALSMPLYEAFTAGFLEGCGDQLTAREIETLPLGAKLITLECGVRFLTDYLNGDVYFAVKHPAHNLDRARTQIRLVEDMEQKWADMNAVISRLHPQSR
ncbi:MAG: aminoglycoside phosphotransferase family protein [Clostridia bacterium]|nr:aminoglycoside phosphotransferase family protein [Clostridia bacterium]